MSDAADASPAFVAIIELHGELDMSSSRSLAAAVRREAGQDADAVIVDLSECPFFDSTALSAMLDLNAELAGRNVPLLIVIPPEPRARRRLISVAGLELALVIFDDEYDALTSLAVEDVPAPAVRRHRLEI